MLTTNAPTPGNQGTQIRARLVWLAVCASLLLGAGGCDEPQGTYADVIAVTTSGIPSQTVFNVTVASPDEGCDRYADWWEVLDEASGALVVRRTLGHSHVDEQPFTRSSGPVDVRDTQRLIIRAHMNTIGVGSVEFRGSLATGFTASNTVSEVAVSPTPTPPACAF